MRYSVFDYTIVIKQPEHAVDFDDDGNQITGLSFKEAKKQLIDQLRARVKEVKEETEDAYLIRKGYR